MVERPGQDWLLARRTGLGGTDLAAIFGLHPYRTAVDVFLDKTAQGPPREMAMNDAMYWGLRLERVVADEYVDRNPGAVLTEEPKFALPLRRSGPIVYASLDFDVVDLEHRGMGCLEVKTTGALNADKWEEGPPIYIMVQLQAQLAVTGRQWGAIAVLFGGQSFASFEIDRNDALIDAMVPAAERWWERHVATGEAPEPTDSESAIRLYMDQVDPGKVCKLPAGADGALRTRDTAQELALSAKETKAKAENRVKLAMGDAEYGVTPDGRWVSWKQQTRKGYTVAESTSRVLRLLKRRPKDVAHGGENG